MKSQLNAARIRLLNKTVDDLIRINSERMQDAFDSNQEARRVLEDSLRLIGVFDEDVVNSTLSALDNPTIVGAESREPETEEIETDTPEYNN